MIKNGTLFPMLVISLLLIINNINYSFANTNKNDIFPDAPFINDPFPDDNESCEQSIGLYYIFYNNIIFNKNIQDTEKENIIQYLLNMLKDRFYFRCVNKGELPIYKMNNKNVTKNEFWVSIKKEIEQFGYSYNREKINTVLQKKENNLFPDDNELCADNKDLISVVLNENINDGSKSQILENINKLKDDFYFQCVKDQPPVYKLKNNKITKSEYVLSLKKELARLRDEYNKENNKITYSIGDQKDLINFETFKSVIKENPNKYQLPRKIGDKCDFVTLGRYVYNGDGQDIKCNCNIVTKVIYIVNNKETTDYEMALLSTYNLLKKQNENLINNKAIDSGSSVSLSFSPLKDDCVIDSKKDTPSTDKYQSSIYNNNYTFTKVLRLGSNNNEVKELQKFLNNNGYIVSKKGNGSKGNESTYLGQTTASALRKYQKNNKLKITGRMDTATIESINKYNK